MRLADLGRRRKLVAAALAGAVAGTVVGLFLPIRAADPPKGGEAKWTLPTALEAKRFRNDQFQAVRSARFWGEIQQPGQRGARRSAEWTLTAIVTRPRVRAAINITGKGNQSGGVGLGETFPDGATLVAANRDTIWYEKDGCRRARKLYQKPTDASEACTDAAGGSTPAAVQTPARPTPATRPAPSTPARQPH